MLLIEQAVKRHGARRVLDRIDLRAFPGRVTAVIGPNGAGKSSALRILLGVDRPDEGRALVKGRPYRDLDRPLRTVGSMLDGSGAHRSRTARNHLAWIAQSNGIPRRRVSEVLGEVGLSEVERMRVGKYSLGMGQRLGLAAALLGEPEALVLDEPVNGLDPDGIRWVRDLLRRHADAGGTVLLSSHLIGEVAGIADDVVIMTNGRVRDAGTLAEVSAGFPSLEHAFFARTGPEQGVIR